jgi:UDP-N-acetylglucosamine--N-acetylmuramyl-(pentapeptide) pyrophosphoryl-undecaprenol N-acetylglucosamine transferase
VALAAGGTGGHVFPALALARTLESQGVAIFFVTDARGMRYDPSLADRPHIVVPAGSLSGNLPQKALAVWRILRGIGRARQALKTFRPDLIVGFGGYPSFPGLAAARSLGISLLIHEQNAVLGRTNRHLARFAQAIATGFPETRLVPEGQKQKLVFTGNPVRAGFVSTPYPAFEGKLRLLVTGGSQGASRFARIVPQALASLPPEARGRVALTLQCRQADLEETRSFCATQRIDAELRAFFDDMPERLAGAHLAIARSGASSVAELVACARPAILVPLPGAMDDHQCDNAKMLDAARAGWIITQDRFTPETLAEALTRFLAQPDLLADAARRAQALQGPDAAQALAALAWRQINKKRKDLI